MRGKDHVYLKKGDRVRITPAGAGKSRTKTEIGGKSEDHPRGCGEKDQLYTAMEYDEGSPPRVRGKDDVAEELSLAHGITPAGAGKRSRNSQLDRRG